MSGYYKSCSLSQDDYNWTIQGRFVLAAPSNGIFVGGLCCISADICLRWESRAWRRRRQPLLWRTKAKRRAPSLFGLITRLSRFIILPPRPPPRILSSNAVVAFDKVFSQLNPHFHQLSFTVTSTFTIITQSGN